MSIRSLLFPLVLVALSTPARAGDVSIQLDAHELPALLLNEVQQLEPANTLHERTIAEQHGVIAALAARVERLESR